MRRSMRKLGIAALIVALTAGMTSNLLFLAAFEFRLDWFLEPTGLLGAGPGSAELLRWASVLDLVGYYLTTGVLAYVLWRLLRPTHAVVADLSTMGAIGYALAGGAGAAALAVAAPMIMHAYEPAAADAGSLEVAFELLFAVVWRAIWQLLDGVLLAVWWAGVGWLIRDTQPGLSRLSLALAFAAAVGVVLNTLGLNLGRDLALGVVFSLWTLWWIWLLRLFLRWPAREGASGLSTMELGRYGSNPGTEST